MRLLVILALGTAGLVRAQFSGLTATEDGSTVYFSSQFRLRGTSQSFDSKIFRLDSAGPALFLQRDRGHQVLNTFDEFYDLVAPQVASNGSVIAFTGTRPCSGGSGCIAVQRAESTVADNSGREILRVLGYVNLSPNGQWAVFSARNTFGNFFPRAELVDLSTGVHVNVPYSFDLVARRRIADDGTIAFFNNGSILLWRTDGQQTVSDSGIVSSTPSADPLLMISNDAQRLVYQSGSGLALYDRTQQSELP